MNATMGQQDAVEAWCRVALHPVFENAGDGNRAKISR
jgi:hypothetical protein